MTIHVNTVRALILVVACCLGAGQVAAAAGRESAGTGQTAQADLAVTITLDRPVSFFSITQACTVTVTNLGGDTATNVVLDLTSIGQSTTVFTPTGMGNLAPGASASTNPVLITSTEREFRVRAQVSSSVADPVSDNNTASLTIYLVPRFDSTSVWLSPTTAAAGDTATLQITVRDFGSSFVGLAPSGEVTVASSVPGDTFPVGTCVLTSGARPQASLERDTPGSTPGAIAQETVIATSWCDFAVSLSGAGPRVFTATYLGSDLHEPSVGSQALTIPATPTTTTPTSDTVPFRENPQTVVLSAAVTAAHPVNDGTVTFTVRDATQTVIGTPVTSGTVTDGTATANYVLPGNTPIQTLTIVAAYDNSANFGASSGTGTLTITEPSTYSLAEGATGSFFHTDLLLANPNTTPAPVDIVFLRDDGTTVTQSQTLPATSRTTIQVDTIAGLASANFSTVVTSTSHLPLVVERTMRWGDLGYGAHTEKANEGVAPAWYFAEGSQGFFHTFFLLLNPHATANVAHVTYVFEDATTVQRDYTLAPTSRLTIDAGADAALLDRSFGATVVFDQPGMAERSMYFGTNLSGGTASAGVTAPSALWYLAEGATGTFFNTFVLIANPNAQDAQVTIEYLLDNGTTVTRQHPLGAHQRLTVNVADEDPTLASAAFATTAQANLPVVVERSQYWPVPTWYEAHNSMAVSTLGQKWGLAEGRVGGPGHTQTYILVSNPNTQPASLTVTFLRSDGSTLVKTFTVAPTSRFNIAITGPGGVAPELSDESFGTIVESTQPILVERAMYTDANGVVWAEGTAASGTRLR